MSTHKKNKYQKIEEEEQELTKPQKKSKNKKKKKDQSLPQSQKYQQNKKITPKQHKQSSLKIKQQKYQHINSNKSQSPIIIDTIGQQLSQLTFDGLISPQQRVCLLINSHLQQLTINLYQTMIMKSSLITRAIQIAKKQLVTPKQYFFIDYTNKLLLIKKLLMNNGGNKYKKFIDMIDVQVARVEGLVLRCLQDNKIFDQVFVDIKKNNLQWEIKQ